MSQQGPSGGHVDPAPVAVPHMGQMMNGPTLFLYITKKNTISRCIVDWVSSFSVAGCVFREVHPRVLRV